MFVVVGGHSRNIGKTAVAAAIIGELSDLHWTAVKITQHGHGICSPVGEPCGCNIEYEHPFAISEEQDPTTGTDSARFLAAGAQRAFWLRAPVGQLGHAVPALRRLLESSRNLIAESNSVLQFFQPDLYLSVLDFRVADFKETALKYLDRADALVTIGSPSPQTWDRVSARLWRDKPCFLASPPQFASPALIAFVRQRLSSGIPA